MKIVEATEAFCHMARRYADTENDLKRKTVTTPPSHKTYILGREGPKSAPLSVLLP